METNVVKIKDYRNTSYIFNDFSLRDKKLNFMKTFKLQYPRVRNIHGTIKIRGTASNIEFRGIYHEKCAYCGLSTQVVDSSRFEVDHVIPVSVLKKKLGYTYEQINGINNLVNSCQMCNRGKTNFYCDEKSFDLLHPDNNNLPKIFERASDYTIVISAEFENNTVIQEFYLKLKLDNQLRRLDYLLMEMKDFCEKHEGEAIINEIQKLIIKIESKRRRNY